MSFTLAPSVSFGEPSGHYVFLHVPSDRYLMVSPAAECALRRLIEGRPVPGDDGLLRTLCGLGILTISQSTGVIAPCRAAPPTRSALDAPNLDFRALAVVRALSAFLRARRIVRQQGLGKALARIERARFRRRTDGSTDGVPVEVAAFAALRTWVGPLDRCLPLSLALVDRCAPHDSEVRLIFGVKLRPFRAHAWVQRGDTVLNDRLDNVRVFTPVLVI